VHFVSSLLLIFFAAVIIRDDIKLFRIKNPILTQYFFALVVLQILEKQLFQQLFVGVIFLVLFTVFYLLGNTLSENAGIGFGDVKLVAVVAFGYINLNVESVERFLISLWWALLSQFILHSLYKRKFLSRMAMAPSIFLAVGLYLWAPMAIHLPQ
jgi:Flp pilus assembly protein protease CpaA